MIRVVRRTLAELPVSAVLRPADERLVAAGTSGAELDRRAGPRFDALRQVQTPLEVGAAVITAAGELTAEFVLHVVIQGEEGPATRDALRRALTSAWHRAEGWQLATVAAPATGWSEPPLSPRDVALLLAETFRERRTADFPAELFITVDDEQEQDDIESLLAGPA